MVQLGEYAVSGATDVASDAPANKQTIAEVTIKQSFTRFIA
jgi:hypothetical protein